MGLVGKIQAQDLHRMAYNALQYCSKDSTAGGTTLWDVCPNGITVVAYDDYFAIADSVGLGTEAKCEPKVYGMELRHLQTLEKYLRDQVEYDLDELLPALKGWYPPELDSASDLIFTETETPGTPLLQSFSLNPDRLRRLSLLRPKGYPLAFHVSKTPTGDEMLLFRYGPTVRGAIALLDEGTLRGIYKGGELWL